MAKSEEKKPITAEELLKKAAELSTDAEALAKGKKSAADAEEEDEETGDEEDNTPDAGDGEVANDDEEGEPSGEDGESEKDGEGGEEDDEEEEEPKPKTKKSQPKPSAAERLAKSKTVTDMIEEDDDLSKGFAANDFLAALAKAQHKENKHLVKAFGEIADELTTTVAKSLKVVGALTEANAQLVEKVDALEKALGKVPAVTTPKTVDAKGQVIEKGQKGGGGTGTFKKAFVDMAVSELLMKGEDIDDDAVMRWEASDKSEASAQRYLPKAVLAEVKNIQQRGAR